MRIIPLALMALLFAAPAAVRGQGISVHAAAGPTLADRGYSATAGVGFSPISRLTLMGSVERSHLPSRIQEFPGGFSFFRGGTFTMASAELRVSVFGRDRVSPYGLIGFSAGRSRPNVTDIFPTPVVRDVVGPFAGGGVHVPLGQRVSLFADLRLALIMSREADDLYGLSPLRAGLSWRF